MFVRGILAGVVLAIAIGAAGAYLAVVNGFMPAGADTKVPALERWAARTSLRASMHRIAQSPPQNPLPPTEANYDAGIKLYAVNCAVCHGAADGKQSLIGKGVYGQAPALAVDGVEDDPPARTFWVIRHGIRFTGMPSFGSLSDEQIWQMTLLLQHMDALPPEAQARWKALPSQALPS